jgi:hypothetical protein
MYSSERPGLCVLEWLDCDCLVDVMKRRLAPDFFRTILEREVAVCEVLALLPSLLCETDKPETIRRLDGGSEESTKGSSTWPLAGCVSMSLLLVSVRISCTTRNGVSSRSLAGCAADLVGVLVVCLFGEPRLPISILRADLGLGNMEILPLTRP